MATEIPKTPLSPVQSQAVDPSLPAATTFQQDLVTAGQRQINLIWESAQKQIAVWVVFGTVIIDGAVVILLILTGRELSASVAMVLGFLHMITSNVLSFYFSRTNHTQTGGVGPKVVELREQGR